MESLYSNLNSVRPRRLLDEDADPNQSRFQFYLAGFALISLVLVGLVWLLYHRVETQADALSKLPVMQTAVDNLDAQQRAAGSKIDSRLADLTAQSDDFRSRVEQATRDLKARFDTAQKQTSKTTAAMLERVQQQVATQVDHLRTRMAKLETSGESDRAQIASLQAELNRVRGQMAEQANQLAAVQGQVQQNASAMAAGQQEVAGIKETHQQDRQDFDSYTAKAAIHRVDFEVSKKHSRQLAPGISMGVDKTNVSYQRVNGWLWVMPARKTIWLRDQRTEDPLVISSTPDGRKSELVITRVSQNSVVGYLLMPVQPAAPANTLVN